MGNKGSRPQRGPQNATGASARSGPGDQHHEQPRPQHHSPDARSVAAQLRRLEPKTPARVRTKRKPKVVDEPIATYTTTAALEHIFSSGSVRLVRASYFLRLSRDGARLPPRQELPPEAFISSGMLSSLLDELDAVSEVSSRFDMFFPGIVAISHAWSSEGHPDPQGRMLRDVLAPALEWYMSERALIVQNGGSRTAEGFEPGWYDGRPLQPAAVDFGVFLDFTSIEQPLNRSPVEEMQLQVAKSSMDVIYAHRNVVKFHVTTPSQGATRNGYAGRGWPFFESVVASITSDVFHSLDLARVDWRQPFVIDTSATGPVAKRSILYRGIWKPPAELAAFGTAPTHLDMGILERLVDRRVPPLDPASFSNMLATKQMSAQADRGLLLSMHVRFMSSMHRHLRELYFEGLGWNCADVQLLCRALPSFSVLEALHLSANPIGPEGALALAELINECPMQRLRWLVLNSCQLTSSGAVPLFHALASGAPNLSHVELKDNQIGDQGFAQFSRIPSGSFVELRELVLHYNGIGDMGVLKFCKRLSPSTLRSLRKLHLSENDIGPPGITALAVAFVCGALSSIEGLYLCDNPLGDEGLRAFARQIKGHVLRDLRSLYISRTGVSDSGIIALAERLSRSGLPSLFKLKYEGNRVTKAGQQMIHDVHTDRFKRAATEYAESPGQRPTFEWTGETYGTKPDVKRTQPTLQSKDSFDSLMSSDRDRRSSNASVNYV